MNEPSILKSEVNDFIWRLELACWASLLMTPVVIWLQGASVSTDQLVVRTMIVLTLGAAALGLRAKALVRITRSGKHSNSNPKQPS